MTLAIDEVSLPVEGILAAEVFYKTLEPQHVCTKVVGVFHEHVERKVGGGLCGPFVAAAETVLRNRAELAVDEVQATARETPLADVHEDRLALQWIALHVQCPPRCVLTPRRFLQC